jgi:glyoxylase-like metal-dependent hydrolase (beta-lactamase superfamily II)
MRVPRIVMAAGYPTGYPECVLQNVKKERKMKRISLALVIATAFAWAGLSFAAEDATVDRLYVLDCGGIHLSDQAQFLSPGVNEGQPIDLLNSCYLIQHGKDWLLWDTGFSDAMVGKAPNPGPIQAKVSVTLASQLESLGVKPSALKYVAISHTHGDHSGNVDLFQGVPVLMQKAEYDTAFAPSKKPPFSPDHPVQKIEGDHDVFGDGSVRILSTTGHTPGHQSLLVHLKKTGYVILTGDAVQTQATWTNRYAPGKDKENVLASMDKLGTVVKSKNAKIWSSHDPVQANEQRKERKYFE